MKIQEKKIRIATVDRCVMCGEIIPEGQQVCGLCKHKTDLDEVSGCIHCDYTGPLEKKDHLEPDNESEVEHDG